MGGAAAGRAEDLDQQRLTHQPRRSSQPSRNPPDPRAAGDVAVYERHGANHDAVADRHTLLDHRLRANVDAGADRDGAVSIGATPTAETTRDGVMGVNLNPSADIAVVSDRKAALSVQDHIGADPAMLPDFDITKNQDIVITRRTFAKSILSCDLPAISQQITDRHVALELLPHLAAQLGKQLVDSVSEFSQRLPPIE